jgi:hypothetical protein
VRHILYHLRTSAFSSYRWNAFILRDPRLRSAPTALISSSHLTQAFRPGLKFGLGPTGLWDVKSLTPKKRRLDGCKTLIWTGLTFSRPCGDFSVDRLSSHADSKALDVCSPLWRALIQRKRSRRGRSKFNERDGGDRCQRKLLRESLRAFVFCRFRCEPRLRVRDRESSRFARALYRSRARQRFCGF